MLSAKSTTCCSMGLTGQITDNEPRLPLTIRGFAYKG